MQKQLLAGVAFLFSFTQLFKNYMKRLLSIGLLLLSVCTLAQTVQSPEQFLGYKLGDKFTPHYKIVNYFKQVSQSRPDMVKLEQYGETY